MREKPYPKALACDYDLNMIPLESLESYRNKDAYRSPPENQRSKPLNHLNVQWQWLYLPQQSLRMWPHKELFETPRRAKAEKTQQTAGISAFSTDCVSICCVL